MILIAVINFLILSIFGCDNNSKSNTKKNNLRVNKKVNTENLKLPVISPYIEILNEYEKWESIQYEKGIYASTDYCNPDSVMKVDYIKSDKPSIGIPTDIDISYTDINNDNKIDGVITFNPVQCDGGNALMHSQECILILSKGSKYIVDDKWFNSIDNPNDDGILHIDGAKYGKIFGTYSEYNNGRCCPSLERKFDVEYNPKKIKYID